METNEQAAATTEESAPSTEEHGTIDLGEPTETPTEEKVETEAKPEPSKDAVNADFIPEEQLTDAVKKRIDKLTAKAYKQERRADELQAMVDAEQKAKDEALLNKPAPTEDEIFDPDELEAAKQAHWVAQGEARGRQAEQREREQQQALIRQQESIAAYNVKAQEFVAKVPDFVQAVQNLNGLHPDAEQALREIGPEGAYFAAKNMDIAQQLHAAAINAENGTDKLSLGRLTSSIESTLAEAAQKRTISQAGEPNEGLNTVGDKPETNPVLAKYPGARIDL